jgi:hypothetical protein
MEACVSKDTPHWPEPQRPFKFVLGDNLTHYKGGAYKIVGLPDNFVIEATREPAYAYRSMKFSHSPIIIRSQKEMEDGRFARKGEEFKGDYLNWRDLYPDQVKKNQP